MKKYIYLLLTALLFVGCGSEDTQSSAITDIIKSTEPYFSLDSVTYDYYEIANDTILHTSINTDIVNVSRLVVVNEDYQFITEHKEFIDDYTISNKALDINETANIYKENILNTLSNKSFHKIYKYGYGLYEIKTNYCIINTDVAECNTYVYAIKQ